MRAEGRRAARPGGAGARSGAGTRAGDDGAGSASDEEGGQGGAGEPPAPSGALVKSANCCLPLCCSHMRATFKHIGEMHGSALAPFPLQAVPVMRRVAQGACAWFASLARACSAAQRPCGSTCKLALRCSLTCHHNTPAARRRRAGGGAAGPRPRRGAAAAPAHHRHLQRPVRARAAPAAHGRARGPVPAARGARGALPGRRSPLRTQKALRTGKNNLMQSAYHQLAGALRMCACACVNKA